MFRQDSATETPFIVIDELRGGALWANVASATLSINKFSSNKFSIYPNPTNTGFVNINSTNNELIKVRVFDVLGKQVLQSNVANNKLNVSSLNTGIYILKLTQNNATVTKKLVIK
jgi:hypothetical protein